MNILYRWIFGRYKGPQRSIRMDYGDLSYPIREGHDPYDLLEMLGSRMTSGKSLTLEEIKQYFDVYADSKNDSIFKHNAKAYDRFLEVAFEGAMRLPYYHLIYYEIEGDKLVLRPKNGSGNRVPFRLEPVAKVPVHDYIF